VGWLMWDVVLWLCGGVVCRGVWWSGGGGGGGLVFLWGCRIRGGGVWGLGVFGGCVFGVVLILCVVGWLAGVDRWGGCLGGALC